MIIVGVRVVDAVEIPPPPAATTTAGIAVALIFVGLLFVAFGLSDLSKFYPEIGGYLNLKPHDYCHFREKSMCFKMYESYPDGKSFIIAWGKRNGTTATFISIANGKRNDIITFLSDYYEIPTVSNLQTSYKSQ